MPRQSVPLTTTQSAEHEALRGGSADRPLSVLAIMPQQDAGEAARQLIELGSGLLARGDRYRIVTGPAALEAQVRMSSIPYRVVRHMAPAASKPAELFSYARVILRELLATPTDVIQCASIRSTYAASLAVFAQGLCRPQRAEPAIVTTLHRSKRRAGYQRAARHLRQLADWVIVPCAPARDALRASRFPGERLSIVPPGCDLQCFSQVARGVVAPAALPGVPPEGQVALAIGQRAHDTGWELLLEAWARVEACIPDTYLVIAGKDASEIEHRARAAGQAIGERVIFTCAHTTMPPLLARASLFVWTSQRPDLPLALVEAMAAARPVIAPSIGGLAEVVEDGVSGLLVPPADVPALAHALARVLADPHLGGRLAEVAYHRAHARYSREALVNATRAIYLGACRERENRAIVALQYGS